MKYSIALMMAVCTLILALCGCTVSGKMIINTEKVTATPTDHAVITPTPGVPIKIREFNPTGKVTVVQMGGGLNSIEHFTSPNYPDSLRCPLTFLLDDYKTDNTVFAVFAEIYLMDKADEYKAQERADIEKELAEINAELHDIHINGDPPEGSEAYKKSETLAARKVQLESMREALVIEARIYVAEYFAEKTGIIENAYKVFFLNDEGDYSLICVLLSRDQIIDLANIISNEPFTVTLRNYALYDQADISALGDVNIITVPSNHYKDCLN